MGGRQRSRRTAATVASRCRWVGLPPRRRATLRDFLFSPGAAPVPVTAPLGRRAHRVLLAKLFARTVKVIVLDEPYERPGHRTLELLEDGWSNPGDGSSREPRPRVPRQRRSRARCLRGRRRAEYVGRIRRLVLQRPSLRRPERPGGLERRGRPTGSPPGMLSGASSSPSGRCSTGSRDDRSARGRDRRAFIGPCRKPEFTGDRARRSRASEAPRGARGRLAAAYDRWESSRAARLNGWPDAPTSPAKFCATNSS